VWAFELFCDVRDVRLDLGCWQVYLATLDVSAYLQLYGSLRSVPLQVSTMRGMLAGFDVEARMGVATTRACPPSDGAVSRVLGWVGEDVFNSG
jgi:hypothetical protein